MTEPAGTWGDPEWVHRWVARHAERHAVANARESAAPAERLEAVASAGLAEADTPWRLLSTVLLLARRPVTALSPVASA